MKGERYDTEMVRGIPELHLIAWLSTGNEGVSHRNLPWSAHISASEVYVV